MQPFSVQVKVAGEEQRDLSISKAGYHRGVVNVRRSANMMAFIDLSNKALVTNHVL